MKILRLEELDSTNNYAKALIKEGKAEDGQVIYAVSQTAGRGQTSKIWESESGKNLTFSLIIEPKNIEAKDLPLLSQAVFDGIVNYLKTVVNSEEIRIKWPNDIYIGTKKISGILIENTIRDNQILFSVIGVGLNVNQTEFSKNAGNPISLSLINNELYDLEVEFEKLTVSIVNALSGF
ncbi:MAG: biotin--[acetyl-CoA-carboxylase] ligase [Bacteroidales bacterium]|nr:biotin--[acetyl-CoA-carboxylase] ligase [Bacteroidales bacterium]